jgi:hypothetical protein
VTVMLEGTVFSYQELALGDDLNTFLIIAMVVILVVIVT